MHINDSWKWPFSGRDNQIGFDSSFYQAGIADIDYGYAAVIIFAGFLFVQWYTMIIGEYLFQFCKGCSRRTGYPAHVFIPLAMDFGFLGFSNF
ncbi:Uncharacterised protein [uncultured archaeon]|nr:Uncharacterised protein [uncultured archaeon]